MHEENIENFDESNSLINGLSMYSRSVEENDVIKSDVKEDVDV